MISKYCKKYCREDISLIKNYDLAIADTEHRWDCHHINELTFTALELIKMNMYYNRPASELIFLTKSEHNRLHMSVCAGYKDIRKRISNSHRNKIISYETRKKISNANKGKITWAKGKHWKLSEETKRKMCEAQKRRWNNK